MNTLTITASPLIKERGKILVELDFDKFERLVANFGFFSKPFLDSLDRAEDDYRNGRISKIKSLKDL